MSQKTALITGASTGIGSELARQLAAKGYHLALVARRQSLLESLAQQLAASGSRIGVYAADVVQWQEIKQVVERVEGEMGPIELVIANAGVANHSGVRSFDVEKAREVYEVNVIGLMQTVAAVLPFMIERRRGHIVGVSSLAAYMSMPRSYAYCASKAAVRAHLNGLRLELFPYGIQVTTICPGFIRTPMTDKNPFKMPLLMDVDEAVRTMIEGLEKGQDEINFPRAVYASIRLLNILPRRLQRRLLRGLIPDGKAPAAPPFR